MLISHHSLNTLSDSIVLNFQCTTNSEGRMCLKERNVKCSTTDAMNSQ